jgi:predicted CXXCH cytochrome family protein
MTAGGGQPTDIVQHVPCNNCHATHTAPSGPYLLKQAKVSETCLKCHDGTPSPDQGANIGALIAAPYRHDTASAVNLPNHIPGNTDCKDCHEPHTMRQAAAPVAAPGLQTSLGTIDGVSLSGGAAARAQYEYEICFKCHADNAAPLTPRVSRVIAQTNTRLEFAPAAVSFHPVAVKGKNTNVPSLRPPYTVDSMMFCTDCHGSDASKKAGGAGPNGPHGSTFPGLLLARYDTQDYTPYTTSAYALCFNCHDNTKVVADSGPFPFHAKHVDLNQTPCSACHDSHGVSSAQGSSMHNAALINFDSSIVLQDDVTHRIEYTRTAPGSGTCTLKCHGKQHTAMPYGQ